MDIILDAYWLVGIAATAGGVVIVLMFLMQAINVREGYRPHVLTTWHASRDFERVIENETVDERRRIYKLILYAYRACLFLCGITFSVLVVLFFISAVS